MSVLVLRGLTAGFVWSVCLFGVVLSGADFPSSVSPGIWLVEDGRW